MEIVSHIEEQEIILNFLKKAEQEQKEPVLGIQLQGQKKLLELPPQTSSFLIKVLSYIAAGKSLTVMPSEQEVTTQQAADILNISRPFLIKLLENKQIPFRKVGSHRRILLKDVVTYGEKMKATRKKNLQFLTQQAQELNLGY